MKKYGIIIVLTILFISCKKETIKKDSNITLLNHYKFNNTNFNTKDTLVTLLHSANYLYIDQLFKNPSDSVYVSKYIYNLANGIIDTFKTIPQNIYLHYNDTGIFKIKQTLVLNNNKVIIDSLFVAVKYYFFVPEDAFKPFYEIDVTKPPSGFQAVSAWFQAVTLKPDTANDGYIVIYYVKLIEIKPDSTFRIIFSANYTDSTRQMAVDKGGLYERIPFWFANNYSHTNMTNSQIKGGLLYVNAGQTPDKISRWWIPRLPCKPNCKYDIEVKYKIIGNIALQTGIDFWRDFASPMDKEDLNCAKSWIGCWWSQTYNQSRTCHPGYGSEISDFCACYFDF